MLRSARGLDGPHQKSSTPSYIGTWEVLSILHVSFVAHDGESDDVV